jgi:hypothetical protein
MKSRIIVLFIALFSVSAVFAQEEKKDSKPAKSENEVKIDQSISIIKKEIENIKKNIDSANLREMAKELEKAAEEVGDALEDIADEVDEKADKEEEKADNQKENDDKTIGVIRDKEGKTTIKTSAKVTRRTKMFFDLGLGLCGFRDQTLSNLQGNYKTWGSNYWDLGLKFKTRIGGSSSKAYFTYGLTYLLNSFESNNDSKIELINNTPQTVFVNNAKSVELNVGYITLPLGLDFKIGKKGKFGFGGYAGYRVRTIQNIKYRVVGEDISEKRNGSYGLNDFMYGASVKVGVGGLVLNGRYNISPLFENSTTPKSNIYNIGLSFGF